MAFRILNTRVDWLADAALPATGDALVIPANEHLWMLSGPGLDLKKAHGKEIEIEAVRQGPVTPGQIVVTSGAVLGYRFLVHAVVMDQSKAWIPGAGREAVAALLQWAAREKIKVVIVHPLYRGGHGRHEEPVREMLSGFLDVLQTGSSVQTVSILYSGPEEKNILHESFLRLLGSPHS